MLWPHLFHHQAEANYLRSSSPTEALKTPGKTIVFCSFAMITLSSDGCVWSYFWFAIVFVTDESIYLLYPHARSSRHKIKIAVIAGHGIETASF